MNLSLTLHLLKRHDAVEKLGVRLTPEVCMIGKPFAARTHAKGIGAGMISSRVGKRQTQNLFFYGKMATKIIFFLVFLVALYFSGAQFKSYFPIKSVKIYGAHQIDQQAVQEALTPLVKKGFFGINVELIKDRLLQSPWVSKAVVQRIWPDKVFITLVEKAPIAHWNGASLLSTNGEIFTPKGSKVGSLPQFVGPEGQQIDMLRHYKKLSGLLEPLHFKIARLELTPQMIWHLTFNNGMKISIGNKDILTRMSHFVKVYPKIIGNRDSEVEYVDLRYANGLAVRWKTIT